MPDAPPERPIVYLVDEPPYCVINGDTQSGIALDLTVERMANVIREDDDENSFFETLARNQGWRWQTFRIEDEAETWLTKE